MPGLLARMMIDQLDLHAVALGPALVHALEHLRPVLALGAAGAGIDLDIGVVAVGLAGEQRLDLVGLGARGEFAQAGERLGLHLGVAFGLGHLDQLDGVVAVALDRGHRLDRFVEPAALLHDRLRLLGIVPQRGILDARVEFVEPALRAVPLDEAADKRHRGVDLVDMGLRFGAHRETPNFKCSPAKAGVQGFRRRACGPGPRRSPGNEASSRCPPPSARNPNRAAGRRRSTWARPWSRPRPWRSSGAARSRA